MLFKGGFWLCFLLLHLGVQSREIPKVGLTNCALDGLNEVQVDLCENGEEITPEEPENEMESEPEGSTETWMDQMKNWLVVGLNEKYAQLEETVGTLASSWVQKDAENQDKLTKLEKDVNHQLKETVGRLDNMQNQVQGLVSTIASKDGEIQQLKGKVEKLEEEVKEVEEDVDELEDEKAKKVYFSAYLDEGGLVTGKLTFPKVMVNIGDAFDGPRGAFKAPIKGVYTFSFSGQQGPLVESGSYIEMLVKRNGQTVINIMDDANTSGQDQWYQNINSIFSLELDENDTVSLELYFDDKLYASRLLRLTFMGQLVTAA